MTTILDLCKVGVINGFIAEMDVYINVFLSPENIGADTKINFIRVSDDEIG